MGINNSRKFGTDLTEIKKSIDRISFNGVEDTTLMIIINELPNIVETQSKELDESYKILNSYEHGLG